MTEINKQLLNMIIQNKTLNEISEKMKLTHKQIYRRLLLLQNNGYIIDRKYYYSGDIVYNLQLSLSNTKDESIEKNEIDIITSPNDSSFKALLISDLHLGSEKESLDALDKVYNYCINESINIIINGGDLIDGMASFYPKKINKLEEQINYALKVYPFDKNILNLIVLGNHDIELFTNTSIDMKKLIYNKRHDIIPIGYREGKINIKNDFIIVHHHIPDCIYNNNDMKNNKITLYGHSHTSNYITNGHTSHIYIPTLSNLKTQPEGIDIPRAIKMNIEFYNGIIVGGTFENLLIADKIYKINTFKIGFNNNNISIPTNGNINLEDDIVDEYKVKKKQISQIDKFNKKYHLK